MLRHLSSDCRGLLRRGGCATRSNPSRWPTRCTPRGGGRSAGARQPHLRHRGTRGHRVRRHDERVREGGRAASASRAHGTRDDARACRVLGGLGDPRDDGARRKPRDGPGLALVPDAAQARLPAACVGLPRGVDRAVRRHRAHEFPRARGNRRAGAHARAEAVRGPGSPAISRSTRGGACCSSPGNRCARPASTRSRSP